MQVEAFLVCDAASDQMGKLSLLGAFDVIGSSSAPFVHPQMSVVLRIRFAKSESGNHPFRLNIVDQDGKSILPKPVDGNVSINLQQAEETAVINLVGNFRDVSFQKFGRYSIDLTMDGKQRGTLPLFANEIRRPG